MKMGQKKQTTQRTKIKFDVRQKWQIYHQYFPCLDTWLSVIKSVLKFDIQVPGVLEGLNELFPLVNRVEHSGVC